jgi:hypothetical protein
MPAEDDARAAYDSVIDGLVSDGATAGMMFGMPCIKIGGKAFAGYFSGDMVFKLRGSAHERALAISGAHLFDPMGGRPMKEWVQVPGDAAAEWPELGRAALETVAAAL